MSGIILSGIIHLEKRKMKEKSDKRNFCCQGLFFRADAHHVRYSLCIEDASRKAQIGVRAERGEKVHSGPSRGVSGSGW